MSGRVERIEFEVAGPGREIDDAAVGALDEALERLGSPLYHLLDPRRINRFEHGGPPVWSVGTVPLGADRLLVTYGLSGLVDPSRAGVGYELSIRIPDRQEGSVPWAGFLLRYLARYVITSGRELKSGDYFPFPSSITTAPFGPNAPADVPMTRMNSVAFTPDPDLPFVELPSGKLELRRVVGLFPEEREAMECWSVNGVLGLMRERNARLSTDIARAPMTTDAAFVGAAKAGSARDGSQYGFVAVDDVDWDDDGSAYVLSFPGGHEAQRMLAMVRARLPFGKHLLVHSTDPQMPRAIVFVPGAQVAVEAQGDDLVTTLPIDHPIFQAIADADEAGLRITLRR
jgi:hypothetical protein